MKQLILLLLLVGHSHCCVYAQQDTASIQLLYKTVKNYYDNNDSIRWYAEAIRSNSKKLNFPKGEFYALRLMGIAAQNEEDNHKAIEYYLQALAFAEQRLSKAEQGIVLTDIGSCYVTLQQYTQAITHYSKALAMANELTDLKLQSICCNNLGACFRHQKKYVEAIQMYQKAAAIKTAIGDEKGLVAARNNIGSLYIFTGKPAVALGYFKQNLLYDQQNGTDNDRYFDYINLGAAYDAIGLQQAAVQQYDSALHLAKRLQSREKEAACYEQLAGHHKKQSNWKQAYDYIEKYQVTYKAFIDEKNSLNIAEMQEKYHAVSREKNNQLLAASLKESMLQKSVYAIASFAILLVALAIGIALFQNRKAKKALEEQHQLVQKQNKKLNELNIEKNSLIGIVSHDLATPFSVINTWNNLAGKDVDNMSDDQVMAFAKIKTATQQGLALIKRILDVDKIELSKHVLQLEPIDIAVLVKQQLDAFSPIAARKKIHLAFQSGVKTSLLVTDRHILQRMIENLLSNAIKFSAEEKKVLVTVSSIDNAVLISVKDEGPGIAENELTHIFTRYSGITNKPLNNEESNGLGLSIVKRLAEEINATVYAESKLGAGSTFYIKLPL